MKIPYSHLIQRINGNPSIQDISNKLFQLGHEHEIENDIFDMDFTPNRGDCLSVNGILRDLSVFYSVNINQDIFQEEIPCLEIDFENLSKEACTHISFLKLEIEEIPSSYSGVLRDYFSDLSLNKNNFFTDVSNYLSYETGQPTHCYEAEKINGRISFAVINSDSDSEFETLIGKKINLNKENAVFTHDNKVINLAGVMGGKSTSCSVETKTVIIECAYFKPEAIIGKSVKYDIQSEAAHKFERGVDPECHDRILRRLIKIVSDEAIIKNMSTVSYKYLDQPLHQILIDVKKINQIIGIKISEDDYIGYLSKLGFDIDGLHINIPSYRSDIRTQNDLAEEVARVIGYNNIPTLPIKIPQNRSPKTDIAEDKIRSFLLDHGFYEVINTPFVNIGKDNSIKVDNPLDSNRKYLRTNVMNSLIDNLLFNERRQKDSIKLFEISDIYSSSNGISKERKLALIGSGRVGLNYEDFSSKIDKKYLTNIFKEILPNDVFDFKVISRDALDTKVKTEILGLEVDIDKFSKNILEYNEVSIPPKNFIKYMPISELPASYKDVSYSIKNDDKVKELQDLMLSFNYEILKKIFIFDYFKNEKKNEIKIGFRLIFQSDNETLSSGQIDVVLDDIISQSLKIDEIEIPGLNLNQ